MLVFFIKIISKSYFFNFLFIYSFDIHFHIFKIKNIIRYSIFKKRKENLKRLKTKYYKKHLHYKKII
jgi:hypothetical protein